MDRQPPRRPGPRGTARTACQRRKQVESARLLLFPKGSGGRRVRPRTPPPLVGVGERFGCCAATTYGKKRPLLTRIVLIGDAPLDLSPTCPILTGQYAPVCCDVCIPCFDQKGESLAGPLQPGNGGCFPRCSPRWGMSLRSIPHRSPRGAVQPAASVATVSRDLSRDLSRRSESGCASSRDHATKTQATGQGGTRVRIRHQPFAGGSP